MNQLGNRVPTEVVVCPMCRHDRSRVRSSTENAVYLICRHCGYGKESPLWREQKDAPRLA